MIPCLEKNAWKGWFFALTLLYCFVSRQPLEAQMAVSVSDSNGAGKKLSTYVFPSLFFLETLNRYKAVEASRPYWVSTEAELKQQARVLAESVPIFLNDDILAFYGHPNSGLMGILGRYSIEELDARLGALAEEYKAASGGRGVRKAFYIIYGTVWPKGEIGIIGEAKLMQYIEYALRHDILVFIDHQIGRHDPVASLKRMLPYLKYPNVHLALDPEWRTENPMKEIGRVTAAEINEAQRVMEEYIVENNIPGERILVIHQFNWQMIRNREQVIGNFERVRLVHCADGFGSPSIKKQSYAYNAQAVNMPIKGFKLFYNFNIPGAGYDYPLLSPKDVYTLNPRPYLIMYQ
ncbi:MAG: hypothetical protein LBB83_00670 [Treponema sp.]|jgi:hypothetical protein|nr:hypothetical protein [Treponema sp.]